MQLRERKIIEKTLFPAPTGQIVKDLPAVGSFSYLLFKVWAKNGSSSGTAQKVWDAFSKFEVIADASVPLISLTGFTAFKISQFMNGGIPLGTFSEVAGDVQYVEFILPFGRSLADEELWLDTGRYTNVQFRATYAFDTTANGFDITQTYYELSLYEFIPPPRTRAGMAKYATSLVTTTAGSGDYVYRLPQGNIIPAIYVLVNKNGVNASTIFTKYTLDVNDGSQKLKEGTLVDILRENELSSWVSQRYLIKLYRAHNATVVLPVSDLKNALITLNEPLTAGQNFPYYTIASISGNQITLSGILITGGGTWSATVADTTARKIQLEVKGAGCSPLFKIIPGISETIEDALNTRLYGNVRLVFTQSVADATLEIIPVEIVL